MYYDQHVCGARIQELRKSKGYTQEALAEAIDIDAKRISKIERGVISASYNDMILFSEFFGVTLDYLIIGKRQDVYFRNGKIEIEKEYRQSVESGRERRFDSKTGEQIFESHYIDGKKEGEEWEIFEEGRTLRSRTTRHYRNGKLDGFYRVESTRDGKPYITIEGQYTDGEKSGRWKQYNATDDTTHEWDE